MVVQVEICLYIGRQFLFGLMVSAIEMCPTTKANLRCTGADEL